MISDEDGRKQGWSQIYWEGLNPELIGAELLIKKIQTEIQIIGIVEEQTELEKHLLLIQNFCDENNKIKHDFYFTKEKKNFNCKNIFDIQFVFVFHPKI